MKRSEVLKRMNLESPAENSIRVIVDSDVNNEADDHFAIMHHLLSTTLDVRAIIAAHYESKAVVPGKTMEKSYKALTELMAKAEIDDVPLLHGGVLPFSFPDDIPESEGCDFIIEEALKDDERPLYFAALGTLTDVAAAIKKCPECAKNITVIWNGGGGYPTGRPEFNLMQDITAARIVLESEAQVWQIPQNVYGMMEVTLAELAENVRPCGELGNYLYSQLTAYYKDNLQNEYPLRVGENWCLGDQPTAGVLLMSPFRFNYHMQKAPKINDDMSYGENESGKEIRVYDSVDVRLILTDFYSKISLCYGK